MSSQNSSPLSISNPAISEILDLRSGQLLPAAEAIGTDWAGALALRMGLSESLASGDPQYVCPLCLTPVYLVSQKQKGRFFFRHRIENGSCPSRTRGVYSEEIINAMRFNGVKESEAHYRLKHLVADSLRADPKFSDIRVEEVVRGTDRTQWRKPDVQALYDGKPVVFEVQISTTFLRVIAERRVFYQREGVALVWVLQDFDPEQSRLAQDDIVYSNNRNILLASEQTLQASKAAGKMILDCRWAEPTESGDSWSRKQVAFEDLSIDLERQRVFFFDYEYAAVRRTEADGDTRLRQQFEHFWMSRSTLDPYLSLIHISEPTRPY